MTLGGWITFLLSTISVSALFIWCIFKVLTAKRPEKMYGAHLLDELVEENPKKKRH